MILKESVRKELLDRLNSEKFGIQALMSFFQDSMELNEEDIVEYLRMQDTIIRNIQYVGTELKDIFYEEWLNEWKNR